MSWEQVSLADTKLEKPSPVPVGRYIFTLQPGAQYRRNQYNNIDELNVRFDVSEGDMAGRPVFVNYPDPTALNKAGKPLTWSQQALKKLEYSLGVDALPGEDSAAYLNRAALQGNARVTAEMVPGRTYVDKNTGAEKTEEPKFGIFSVNPAA